MSDGDDVGAGESFGMTDLEEALRADEAGTVRAAVVGRLEEALGRVGEAMRRGVPPSQFDRTRHVFDALAAARYLVIQSTRGR